MACPYKRVFGDPNTGIHSTRILGLAAVDVAATFAAAALLSALLRASFPAVLAALVGLGIIAHRVFCVNTTLNVLIFGKV
jgi:hypothetical protein